MLETHVVGHRKTAAEIPSGRNTATLDGLRSEEGRSKEVYQTSSSSSAQPKRVVVLAAHYLASFAHAPEPAAAQMPAIGYTAEIVGYSLVAAEPKVSEPMPQESACTWQPHPEGSSPYRIPQDT